MHRPIELDIVYVSGIACAGTLSLLPQPPHLHANLETSSPAPQARTPPTQV